MISPPPTPTQLAEAHVDWLLEVLRPLLIAEFVHGYKHGVESTQEDERR